MVVCLFQSFGSKSKEWAQMGEAMLRLDSCALDSHAKFEPDKAKLVLELVALFNPEVTGTLVIAESFFEKATTAYYVRPAVSDLNSALNKNFEAKKSLTDKLARNGEFIAAQHESIRHYEKGHPKKSRP